MRRWLLCAVLLLSVLGTRGEAQEILVNDIVLQNVYSKLNITIDMTELPQGADPVVRLVPGRKHYALWLFSPLPIAMFDAELPSSVASPRQFTIAIEDGRQFQGCLVKGLASSGSSSSR